MGIAAVAVLAALFVVAMIVTQKEVRQTTLADLDARLRESAGVRLQGVVGGVQAFVQDVLFLSATPPIQGIVRASANRGYDELDRTTTDQWKRRLTSIFSAYVGAHSEVTQLRYIGVADGGAELVRVDRTGSAIVVSAPDTLQAKGDRDYFLETVKRAPGEVYVSEINLNREHGQVEVPHVPTLRIAVPVYQGASQVFGIVVINLDMAPTLRQFMAPISDGIQPYLMNCAGDFLVHPDGSRVFGFDLGQRHRWDDEFQPARSSLAHGSGTDSGHDFTREGQLVHVAVQRAPLDRSDPQRCVIAALVAPDTYVSGEIRRVQGRVAAVFLFGGLVLASFLLVAYFGARNRYAAMAKKAELGAIVDSSIDAIVGKDLRGVVSSWNRAAQRMFGYSAEEAVGQTIADLVLPPDRVGEEDRILASIAAGTVVPPFDTVRRRKDGSLIDVSVTVSPIWGPDGEIIGAAKIARDITEQKAAQARILELNESLERQVVERTRQLEASVALQKAVVDNAGYAVIATDGAGTITLFNRAAEALFGYEASEMVGKLTPAVLHDHDDVVARARQLSAEFGRLVEPGFEMFVMNARARGSDEAEWLLVHKGGRRFPAVLKLSTLRESDGRVTGFLGIVIDLSERKRHEEELKEAKTAADAANKAKGEFLANMSHEIRSPMNAVIGMVELLRRTELNDTQLDYVDKADAAAHSLLDIINDVLDFSKIDAGRLELECRPFSVEKLLRDVSVIVGANVGSKDVEILFRIDPNVPRMLLGDSVRLRQVLLNLVGNAVKFTEHGEVVIALGMSGSGQGGSEIEFSVRDTGIGMSPEQQQRIFKAFTQAEAGTTRRYGGTGLGLVISQRLVRLMGGDLHLKSQLGQGSTFWFSVVLGAASEDEAAHDGVVANAASEPSALTVLIVDDNSSARQILSELAASLGWKADAVASGAEAIARVQAVAYDLLFVDWLMPDLDGWHTARRVRDLGLGEGKTPVIVMITAHVREMLASKMAEDEGVVDGFLVKPVTRSDLHDAVADAMAGRNRSPAASARASTRRLAGMRVLAVEDNPTNQQVVRELLGHEGATVEVAGSGSAAIAALRDATVPFDVVLMDIQMPDMDGYTTTRKIRGELGMVGIPIIAMTANVMSSDREACLAAGMNDHVGKPFHIDRLVQSLLEASGRSATEPDAGSVDLADVPDSPQGYAFAEALQRLGNNRTLYARQCRNFAAAVVADLHAIRELVEASDRDQAARSVHSLRGVAGTLGAARLAARLSELEGALKSSAARHELEPMLVRLESLAEEASRVLSDLAEALEPASAATDASAHRNADAAIVAPLLAELEALLSENNMRALDVYGRLESLLEGTAVSLPDKLDRAVNGLQFAAAVKALRDFRKRVAL